MHTASAQVVAYKAAPASQRPTILSAGNGVPLVNIQTPSAAGVSRNTYEQFDVQTQGVILNNSRTNVATQLGGWVQGNPWLARGTARVILNEVISANPSQLLGYVEVAGSAAQVVIANPAGVTCNGCGFINASRATLTTGTPIVSSNLDGYRVEGGTIRVEGAGMDASRVGYTDLIARAVEVNAGIWAQTLKVTAGTNVVGADNAQATPIAVAPGSGAAPAFAIDVAQLGGMYAGKIVLVGTEAGVGVRNAGHLGASAGEVLVTADGQLTNSGSLIAAGNVGVDARAGIANTGTVYAQGDLGFATAGDITNNGGLVAAGNHATLAASGATSRILGDATSVFTAGLNADGSLAAVGKLDLSASEQIATRGQQLAGGDLALSARHLDLVVSTNSGRHVSLTASAGDIDLSRASTVASGTLAANTTQALIHNDAQSNAHQLNLAAVSISNVRGEIVQTGSGDTVIALAGKLDNREGRIAGNSANLSLAAQTLNNTDGRIEHAGSGTLAITADTLAGTRGEIASNGTLALAAQTATLDAASTVAHALDIQAETLSNQGGSLAHTGNGEARINVAGRLDNRSGTLVSNGDATLTAGILDNRNSGQIATAGDQTLSTDTLVNDGGQVSAGRTLQATIAQGVGNAAGLIVAGSDLGLTAASLDNTAGTLGAVAGSLDANATGAIDNTAGRIEAAQNITLASAGLTNTDGTVVGDALSIDTRSQALGNTRGRLVANATMNLQTGALTNAAGLIQAAAALTIDTHGQAFDNTAAGSTSGQAGVTVAAGAFNNAAGFLGAGGPLAVVADSLANTASGLIVSEAEMALNTRQLDNRSGQIQSAGNLVVRATDSADNTGGLLRAGQALTVDTASLANANTLGADQGIEGNALAVSANTIDNRSGALRANTALAINSSGALNNSGGLITSAQHVAIRDAAATKTLAVANTAGTITAGEQLDIDAASLSGGQLLSHRDLAIDLGGNLDNTGEITANRNARINVGGTLDNSGTLQAGTTLAVTAGSIDNRASGELLAPNSGLLRPTRTPSPTVA
ncbi:MAG: filamentous hemagglutinin N-terminal domain-containing protein [Betaproteobacteria bacterium]|nr:filamentous hemagglutinin N-terminal domain-containing protein [Betaproteobacteria bacterium]